MTFDEAVLSVRDGRMTFDEFARVTHPRWLSLALYIMRRWHLPPAVEPADVVQELLLGAWRAVWKYEPHFGGTASRYVVWNAVDKAKKRVHRMRGANLHGNPDGAPGRPETVFARFRAAAEDPEYFSNMMVVEPEQDAVADETDRVNRARRACKGKPELHVVEALARTGSVRDAVVELYRDADVRLECGLKDERQALRLVTGTAARVAVRLRDEDAAMNLKEATA